MNKHSFAISFALIGAGIGGYISSVGESGSFLPVIYGLCGGAFIGYFISGLMSAKSTLLQQNFQKLGDLRGKTIDEITSVVGAYSEFKPCTITDRNNEQGKFYIWTEDRYSITLLFGADGKCIGVNNESRL